MDWGYEWIAHLSFRFAAFWSLSSPTVEARSESHPNPLRTNLKNRMHTFWYFITYLSFFCGKLCNFQAQLRIEAVTSMTWIFFNPRILRGLWGQREIEIQARKRILRWMGKINLVESGTREKEREEGRKSPGQFFLAFLSPVKTRHKQFTFCISSQIFF